MSFENVNKSSIVAVNNVAKRTVSTTNRVNIDILKNRIYKQERKEKFQIKIILLAFCGILSFLGYVISL